MWSTNVAFFEEATEEEVFAAHDAIMDELVRLGAPFDTVTTVWLPDEDKQ